jgi:hypothetical protein
MRHVVVFGEGPVREIDQPTALLNLTRSVVNR